MKSWKTTTGGILAIIAIVVDAVSKTINGQPIDYLTVVAAIAAAIGLLFAKDSQVTGGTIPQPSVKK